ncbi:hypothetical protein SD81_001360 [Tolypothrix campylonemoides VB511288]|nr:hypothetical protein SD81_001360 [Tolypothrix campylonemoides VB511288]
MVILLSCDRLIDSDVARFVESGYKQSGLPLPLYMTSLLEGNGKAWEKAQQELAEYMKAQSEDTAPTLKVGDKVAVAGQIGTIADFEFKQLLNQTYPVIAWESGGKSALAPQNVKKVVDVQKSEIEQLLAQIKRCDECIGLIFDF